MAQATPVQTQGGGGGGMFGRRVSPYEQWISTLELPIHRGYYIEDVRTCEVAPWPERGLSAAVLVMAGQEGQSEVRVSEIAPGATTKPVKFAMDEIVYIAEGRGLTTVSAEGHPSKTFEWQKHSVFMLPRGYTHQFSNTSGSQPARLLHYNSLPAVMDRLPDPDFFFNGNTFDPDLVYGEGGGFAEAKVVHTSEEETRGGAYWTGNFFPDMGAWDNLVPFKGRGAGGHVVWIRYPNSGLWNHMSVFGTRTYKKGHRHGAGVLIVIPKGEGFSYMWPQGKEKVYIPWHEGSVFVPPNMWFHQHFNVSDHDDRYLAFHPAGGNGNTEALVDPASNQIEYDQEDPIVRETFQKRLAENGLTTLMPDECYKIPGYEWEYGDGTRTAT